MLSIILILIVVGVGLYLLSLIPMDAAILQIIRALVIVAVVVWILTTVLHLHIPGHF